MRNIICLLALMGIVSIATADEVTLKIKGMTCPVGCVDRVQKTLAKVDGVTKNEVEVGQAKVTYNAAKADKKTIVAAIEKAGYTVEK